MAYQTCPHCKGSGIEPIRGGTQSLNKFEPCGVCKGHKIINEFTGKPPADAPTITFQK